MIRHCVFVKFKPEVNAAERQSIYAALDALRDRVEGFIAIACGANVSPEGLGKGFNDGFTIDFANAAARDAYLEDADHKAVGSRIVAAAEGGIEGLVVFDIEVG